MLSICPVPSMYENGKLVDGTYSRLAGTSLLPLGSKTYEKVSKSRIVIFVLITSSFSWQVSI